MRKLIRYLKPYSWFILAIFVLLFGQAMADLSLPSYMADIVNVGIQQSGIEHAVPQAMRASEFQRATLLMTDEQKARVTADYVLLDRATLSAADFARYAKTYPVLATTPVYKLNTTDKTEIAALDTIFGTYLPVVATIEQQGLSALDPNL